MPDTRHETSGPYVLTQSHSATDRPGARGDLDLWEGDVALREHGFGADSAHLALYGSKMGRQQMRDAGRNASLHLPAARLSGPDERRLSEITYHPSYQTLMDAGLSSGYAALPWEGAPGGHSTHAAMVYITAQINAGVCIPMSMTHASVPALRTAPALLDRWVPKLTARLYDPALLPLTQKTGATIGVAIAESQGAPGSEKPTIQAVRDGDAYRLSGHTSLCPAPMSDGLIVLAQAPGGLTAFLVPRWLEGAPNSVQITRLGEALGTASCAAADLKFDDALAYPLGEEGEDAEPLSGMTNHIRLDAGIASAGVMRAALSAAHHWCTHRGANDARMIDQPLMQSVLADLALDWEGALALSLTVARALDEGGEQGRAFGRLGAALAKYMNSRLCPQIVAEAMECLGGIGSVEESSLLLLCREAPKAGIWGEPGNVLSLEILRILREVPLAGNVLSVALGTVTGGYALYDTALRAHMDRFPRLPSDGQARWYADSIITLLTASLLIRHAPAAVAEGYVSTRLTGARGRTPGSIKGVDFAAILARLG